MELLGDFGGKAKSSVPALKALLEEEDYFLRRAVAEALNKIQGEARSDDRQR